MTATDTIRTKSKMQVALKRAGKIRQMSSGPRVFYSGYGKKGSKPARGILPA